MKETVRLLREGWYDNGNTYMDEEPRKRKEIDCSKLCRKTVELATTKFVPVCKGVEGTIGSLLVDENYEPEPCDVPIDTLVLTFNKETNESDEQEVTLEEDDD